MKPLILLLVFSFFAQSAAPTTFSHNERIIVDYDKFKDSTGVVLFRMQPGIGAIGDLPQPFQRNQIDISLFTHFAGKVKPSRFDGPILMALRFEPNWPEYNLPDLILLIDGRREVLPTKRGLAPDLRTERRYEARIDMRYAVLAAIRDAKRVEGQFGAIEFHLEPANFEAIRDFDSRLRL